MITAEIITNKGVIKAELFADDAPKNVESFVNLSKMGFYEGLKFHRVIKDFVIQAGCPYSIDMTDKKVGTGGPGYNVECETDGEKQHHDIGVLSMAHAGRNTGGSQFFICLSRNNTKHLDGMHTCFGKIYEGIEIIEEIEQGDTIEKINISEF